MSGLKIEFTAEMAAKYAAMIRTSIPGYDDMHQMVLSLLLSRLSEQARVLVVGAGEGQELVCLKKARPAWRLTGVDPSADMLSVARGKLAEAGFEAELYAGETAHLPEGDPFDAATSVLVMHFVKGEGDKRQFLRDIAARLKPGAPYLHVELCGDADSPEFRMMQEAWDHFQLCKGRGEGELKEHNQRRANSVFPMPPAAVERLLADAGFTRPALFYRAFNFCGWAMEKAV